MSTVLLAASAFQSAWGFCLASPGFHGVPQLERIFGFTLRVCCDVVIRVSQGGKEVGGRGGVLQEIFQNFPRTVHVPKQFFRSFLFTLCCFCLLFFFLFILCYFLTLFFLLCFFYFFLFSLLFFPFVFSLLKLFIRYYFVSSSCSLLVMCFA